MEGNVLKRKQSIQELQTPISDADDQTPNADTQLQICTQEGLNADDKTREELNADDMTREVLNADDKTQGGNADDETQGGLNAEDDTQGGSDADDETQGGLDADDEPRVGMEFPNEESAFEFYNRYASKVGFSVRKNSTMRVRGVLTRRQLCCSKQGLKHERSDVSFHRATSRTNCPAKMTIKLHTNGNYVVYKFEATHNHEVVAPDQVHMLRSHRKVVDSQKDEESIAMSSKIIPKATKEISGGQAGVDENLAFQRIDHKNYLSGRRMRDMERGDAGAILEFFQKKQVEDPSFFYALQLDVDDKVTNVFWADAKSIMDYSFFGDVVCFDTTYNINNYNRPFAQFIGVNHHKQIIIFGGALLYDETVESFKWLFETFLGAMGGKPPITILTDECAAMATAIAIILPDTFHRLCAWHIFQSAAKHLSNAFHGSRGLQLDFKRCVYDCEDEVEFCSAWHDMLIKYNLTENEWLKILFCIREKWGLAYDRNTFCGDIITSLRCEHMNDVLKEYLDSKYDLLSFFKHYEQLVTDYRYNESKADFKMSQSMPTLFAEVKMLKEASMAFTPEVFEIFQKEYEEFLTLELFRSGESGTTEEFQVICEENNVRRAVAYDSSDNTVHCSCKKFEFSGILCSHALKVLDFFNVKALPSHYILKRWHRNSKAVVVTENHGTVIEGDPKEARRKRYNILHRKMIMIAATAARHDETFQFAQNYCDKFHGGVMDCIKSIKELSSEKEFSSVELEESQTVKGVKTKRKTKVGHRAAENLLHKGSKKRIRNKTDQQASNQEGEEILQRQILHQPLHQSPHYPTTFPILNQLQATLPLPNGD